MRLRQGLLGALAVTALALFVDPAAAQSVVDVPFQTVIGGPVPIDPPMPPWPWPPEPIPIPDPPIPIDPIPIPDPPIPVDPVPVTK